jgi:hypothetical protein
MYKYQKKPTPQKTNIICVLCANRLKCFELIYSSKLCGNCIGKTKPNGERNTQNNTTGTTTNTG